VSCSVGQLQLEITFDLKLKEMVGYKDDENDILTKAQRSRFDLIQSLTVFIYFLVVPYCQSPSWCLEYYHDVL
jgi:hypothetical protein